MLIINNQSLLKVYLDMSVICFKNLDHSGAGFEETMQFLSCDSSLKDFKSKGNKFNVDRLFINTN